MIRALLQMALGWYGQQAQPAAVVSRPLDGDPGAGSGSQPSGSSSPEPAGAQPDPVKTYADTLAAWNARRPRKTDQRAELTAALHAALRAGR